MRLGDLQPYDLSALGTRPMLSLEAQWLPLNLDSLQPGLQAGVFSSVGYAQHQVNLRSPTGSTLDNTQLHTLKAQLGGEARLRLPGASPWSLQAKAGLGRLNEIQSSSSSIANQSTALTFVSLGLGGEYALLERVSGFAGYEFRAPVQSDDSGASLPRHNLMVGFLGNFE